MKTTERRFTAEQFVLMAASVDYTKGEKLNALHQMLTQAATDTARIAELTADLKAADMATIELSAEVARLRDALQTIADNPASLTGPDFTWTHWADIARNALKEG